MAIRSSSGLHGPLRIETGRTILKDWTETTVAMVLRDRRELKPREHTTVALLCEDGGLSQPRKLNQGRGYVR